MLFSEEPCYFVVWRCADATDKIIFYSACQLDCQQNASHFQAKSLFKMSSLLTFIIRFLFACKHAEIYFFFTHIQANFCTPPTSTYTIISHKTYIYSHLAINTLFENAVTITLLCMIPVNEQIFTKGRNGENIQKKNHRKPKYSRYFRDFLLISFIYEILELPSRYSSTAGALNRQFSEKHRCYTIFCKNLDFSIQSIKKTICAIN